MKIMLNMFFWLAIATWGINSIIENIHAVDWVFWVGLIALIIGLIGVAREIYSKDKENGRVKKSVRILEKKA